MRSLIERIYATLDDDQLYLFPTEDGNEYTDRGWKTMWQRCMQAAIAEKVIKPTQRFNFHALRRYYNTMHKAEFGSNANLHADPAVTGRIYDATTEEKRRAL